VRRFLYVLGALTLIVIVGGGVGFGILAYKGRTFDRESRAFVDNLVPALAAKWSKQQFLELAAPELRTIAKPDQLDALFNRLSQLGPLVKYEGATGQSSVFYTFGFGSRISAFYVAKAQFQNGSASFRIGLLKREGRWMIQSFYVDPASSNRGEQGT
jgi:hypothetical protein